jgi:hypothetical protein
MEKIFAASPMWTAKQRCESLCGTVAASSMSSTPKVMAIGCLKQSADLALRASFLRNWMRPIVRGRRKLGSKSKTRRPLLQHVHLVGFSNSGSMKTLRRRLKFIIQGSTRPTMVRNLGYISRPVQERLVGLRNFSPFRLIPTIHTGGL